MGLGLGLGLGYSAARLARVPSSIGPSTPSLSMSARLKIVLICLSSMKLKPSAFRAAWVGLGLG